MMNGLPGHGWIAIYYTYNFGFTYNYRDSALKLPQWINAISLGSSRGLPNGLPTLIKHPLRDHTFLYALSTDFYNQLYNTGYYASHPADNPFEEQNYLLNRGFFDDFRDNLISQLSLEIKPSFPTAEDQRKLSAMTTVLKDHLRLPQPSFDHNRQEYKLTFYFNHQQYLASQQTSYVTYFTAAINTMLEDREATVIVNRGSQTSAGGPQFTNATNDQAIVFDRDRESATWISMQIFNNLVTASTIVQNSNDVTADIIGKNSGNFVQYSKPAEPFMVAGKVTLTVQRWSPMLMLYFAIMNPAIDFAPDGVCRTMGLNAGGTPFTLPTQCFRTNCALDPQRCERESRYCQYNYQVPTRYAGVLPRNYLRLADSSACLCQSANIAPITDRSTAAFDASVCFDSQCGVTDLKQRGLTDSQCRQHCTRVWGWATDRNSVAASTRVQGLGERFRRICGVDFQPFRVPQLNVSVAQVAALGTVLLTAFAFLLGRSLRWTPWRSTLAAISTAVVVGGLGTFLSFDLAGVPWCDGRRAICEAKYSKLYIPKALCPFEQACECNFNEDCGSDNCSCVNTLCVPLTDTGRQSSVKRGRHINMIATSNALVVAICVPLLIAAVMHWRPHQLHDASQVAILLTCIVTPLLVPTFMYNKPRLTRFFDRPCGSTPNT